jgi:thioredoxin reductase (NADPH)
VAGTLWSATSHQVKDFLARSQVPYKWLDIELDADAAAAVESAEATSQAEEHRRLPVVFFPDGDSMIEPTIAQLAERIGQHTNRPSRSSTSSSSVPALPAWELRCTAQARGFARC